MYYEHSKRLIENISDQGVGIIFVPVIWSWSWSHSFWRFIYCCYQWQYIRKFWIRFPPVIKKKSITACTEVLNSIPACTKVLNLIPACARYNVLWKSFVRDLRTVDRFLQILRFHPRIHLTALISQNDQKS